MIYLVGSNLEFKGVKTLILNEIKYQKFSVNLADFNAIVLTSKNSINALKFNSINADENSEIFAIGETTAEFARSYGFNKIYTAINSHGNEFAFEILSHLKGKNVLFLRAKDTVSNIDEILASNGISFTQIIAYKNAFKPSNEPKPAPKSVIIFSAPSAVRNFIKNYGWDDSYGVVAIGKTTANELKFTKNLKISNIQTINECINLAKTFF